MKKYFPVILFLAAITLSACGSPKVESEKVESQKVESKNIESKKSLKELLSLGTSQKCSYEINENGSLVKGEIIVKGDKFRQNTEISNDQGKMKVYAVSDGIYYYSWGDALGDQGTKMKIADLQNLNPSPADAGSPLDKGDQNKQQNLNMDEKFDYKCVAATLSESDLMVPSDIKFVDYTEMIKGFQQGNFGE